MLVARLQAAALPVASVLGIGRLRAAISAARRGERDQVAAAGITLDAAESALDSFGGASLDILTAPRSA